MISLFKGQTALCLCLSLALYRQIAENSHYAIQDMDTLLGSQHLSTYDNTSENDQDVHMDMIILLFRHDKQVRLVLYE